MQPGYVINSKKRVTIALQIDGEDFYLWISHPRSGESNARVERSPSRSSSPSPPP